MLKIFKRPLAIGALAALLGGVAVAAFVACSTLSKLKKEPIARLESVQVAAPDADGATLLFGISVENPNEAAIEVDGLDYSLEIEGKPFASGAIEQKASVPALGAATIQIPVRVKYRDLFASVLDFLRAGSRKYRLTGHAKIGWLSIPFEKSGVAAFRGGG
jgi:LEA14-like dessication related protein